MFFAKKQQDDLVLLGTSLVWQPVKVKDDSEFKFGVKFQ